MSLSIRRERPRQLIGKKGFIRKGVAGKKKKAITTWKAFLCLPLVKEEP